MGRKKLKEPQQTSQNDTVLGHSGGIFNTLFGNAPEQSPAEAAAACLFSDNNPFRRKPSQAAPVSKSTNHTQSPNDGGSGNHDSSDEKKKRKRNKEEKPVRDSDSVTKVSEKKKKKNKHGSDDNGGEGKGLNLGAQAIGKSEIVIEDEEGNGKKKRKREELEKEWEDKKYGMVEGGEEGEGGKIGNKTVGTKRKMLDDPADMLVSKEGFDDEDKLLRTVFVGNLPLKLKKKTLLKEFKKFGEVESVRIRSVPIQDVGVLFV